MANRNDSGMTDKEPWMINEIRKREREQKRERDIARLPARVPMPQPDSHERPDQGYGYDRIEHDRRELEELRLRYL